MTAAVSTRRSRAMLVTDNMSSSLRECVHEFGLPIVQACLDQGVTSPANIRQLVHEIWAGAREMGQRSGARNEIDWLLMQSGGMMSYATLHRVLLHNSMAIVPIAPTRAMLDASMSTVSGFNVRVTREEKHRRRLAAAIRASMDDVH